MSRNLIVCIDGTSDFAAKRPTHVFRLFRALERSEQQLAYYDGGVGTLRDVSVLTRLKRSLLRGLDLAAATTIHRSFTEAYRFLVRNYREGDKVFLFGFSRGAYTVRALAGAVRHVGLLYPEQENLIPYVWQEYSTIGEEESESDAWRKLRRMKSAFARPITIEFVGAWDTVSSVGFLKLRTLPQTSKLQAVKHVRHAVAIDERRNMFPENLIGKSKPTHLECWFAGVHRDVGGGGRPDALALSMIPFEWVIDGALAQGLILDAAKEKKMRMPTSDPCGRDNRSNWTVIAFAMAGLIPMKWWEQSSARFVWKWPNLLHVRQVPDSACVHASVHERMKCHSLFYHPKLPDSEKHPDSANTDEDIQ